MKLSYSDTVDILRVFPEHELEDIIIDYTYKEAAKNE